MKIRPTRKTRQRRPTDPTYNLVVVNGVGDASPEKLTLMHKDWVCWVNPKSPGSRAFVVRFVSKSPLKDVHGKSVPDSALIVVNQGAPSCWYQFKGGIKKGDRFEYMLVVKPRKGQELGPSQLPGPEIISGD